MRRKVIYLLILLGSSSIYVHGQLFVSTSGNDGTPGTFEKPFRTLEQALQTALVKRGEHVAIYLREGTFYLDKPVRLTADKLQPASLQISGYKDERIVISAGKRLDLQWKPFKNGIYVAKVPGDIYFERLYVNRRTEPFARYPNYDSTARVIIR